MSKKKIMLSESRFFKLFENSIPEYWEPKGVGLKKYFTDEETKARQCTEKYHNAFVRWCIDNYGKKFEQLWYCNFNELYDKAEEMGAKPVDFYNYVEDSFEGNNPEWRFEDTGFFQAPTHLTMHHEKTFSNKWVIHFTDSAEDIARDGFGYGVDDYEKLPWTHDMPANAKNGDFAFGHLVDTIRYQHINSSYYGNDCVICLASGVEVYHKYDDEYDAIFNGKAVRYICPIYHQEYWYITDIYTDNIIYKNKELINVIKWFINNYKQYHKHLFYREK